MAQWKDKEEKEGDIESVQALASQCEGSVVEVQTEDNRLLFVGTLARYEPRSDEIRIDLHRGNETPQGVIYNTPVKIQAHMRMHWGKLAMFYGTVVICASDYWRVKVTSGMLCADVRRAFRQPAYAEGWITWGEDEKARQVCRLEDISLVGVAFVTSAELAEGDMITLTIPRLLKGGPTHELSCRVAVRRESDRGPNLWRYGCEYVRLGKRQEDLLCRDIFNLQAKSVNRK